MNRPARRQPLTKTELLPLPANMVRSLSLEHHLALSLVRNGQADANQFSCLARLVYYAFFMRDVTVGGANLEPFRRAETGLERCLEHIERGEPCALSDAEVQSIDAVARLHDAQLAIAPQHRYRAAWERVTRLASSPIPPAP